MNTSKVGESAVEGIGRAGADQRDEDQTAAPQPVGERDRDQRHQHAGPRDREGRPERLVGPVEGTGDRVAVLREQGTAEVGEEGDRGQRAEPGRLLGGERHRRDDREQLERTRGRTVGRRGPKPGGGVGERAARAEPRLDAEEPGEERDHHVADRDETDFGGCRARP